MLIQASNNYCTWRLIHGCLIQPLCKACTSKWSLFSYSRLSSGQCWRTDVLIANQNLCNCLYRSTFDTPWAFRTWFWISWAFSRLISRHRLSSIVVQVEEIVSSSLSRSYEFTLFVRETKVSYATATMCKPSSWYSKETSRVFVQAAFRLFRCDCRF